MATTKTLTPTNQAITLAAFTEKPDNRTNVTNDDKLADAVNALNSKSFDRPENSTNFNNISVAGAYCFSWIQNGTTYNRPVNQGGLLVVSIGYGAETMAQQYTDTNGKVYARGYHDGAWTAWQELAISSNLASSMVQTAQFSISPNSYTDIDYPTGYTQGNTRVLSAVVAYYYVDFSNLTVQLTASKIRVFNGTAQNWAGVQLVLARFAG